jgi:hypothetical protein
MAKVTDVFLNGTIGNVVFYRRMGTQCARSRPLNVKQSAATKIRSANFGIAARAGYFKEQNHNQLKMFD